MALFSLVIGGVMSANFYGMRISQLTKAKLGATDDGRRALTKMSDEIRSAWIIKVGNGSATTFNEVSSGALQQGSAIQVYTNFNDMNTWVRYYFDSSTNQLKRIVAGQAARRASVVADSVANSTIFSAEDFSGNVLPLADDRNNRVISVKIEFNEILYPSVKIGPGKIFEYYKIETKVTRRYRTS